MPASSNKPKTAFVLAGGGSFGAIQVGMLHSLAAAASRRTWWSAQALAR